MNNQEKIYELSEMICKGCKTRHDCDTENCIMSEVVAEYLLNNGYGKLSEVAKDILQPLHYEIDREKCVGVLYNDYNYGLDTALNKIKNLSEKYGVEIEE